jgi:3-hydroxy-9,10-secoandrosta-1,3,5(10)-triene-9,17-dione monooxygenase
MKTAPSFTDVSHAEAVERARALVPALRERAARAEEARVVLPETMADLHRTGLLRALQPKRWGGMELGIVAAFDIGYELARGCASTSWTAVNLLIHHWMLALYEEQGQRWIWDTDPEACIASGVATAQGGARKVEGGYRVSGRWNFSSGVNVSDWNMLAATVREGDKVVDHRLCLLHKSEYAVVDDWQVLGMRSTGSMTVVAEDVFVPTHRAACMYETRGGDHPGAAVNPGAVYRVALPMLAGHIIGAVLVGNAQAALEMTVDSVKARSTSYTGARMRDIQAIQIRTGAAGARIAAARQLMRSEYIEAQEIAERGEVPDLETKLRCKRDAAYVATLCTEAVDILHALAGANGLYDTYPIQRTFRDAHAGASHFLFGNDLHFSNWGLLALGGDVKNPLL